MVSIYKLAPHSVYGIADRYLVDIHQSRSIITLSKVEAVVLRCCGVPRTLEQHVHATAQRAHSSQLDLPAITEILHRLIASKLLVTENDLLEEVMRMSKSAISPDDRHSIDTLAVITAGRPDACDHALRSFMSNALRYRRALEYIVVDDTRDPEMQESYIKGLRQIAKETHQPLRYASLSEKRTYAERLCDYGINAPVLEFALVTELFDGICSPGANRNSLLCDSVGKVLLSVDDDTECVTAKGSDKSLGLTLSGHQYLRNIKIRNTRNQVRQEAAWEDVDILGKHQRLLGRRLGDVLNENGNVGMLDVSDACFHLLPPNINVDNRICVTIGGIVGDCALGDSSLAVLLAGSLPSDFNPYSISDFQTRRIPREVISIAPDYRLVDTPWCMATNLGLDNHELLPPFAPIGRGEDGVFASTYSALFQNALFGHIPVGVLHNPLEERINRPSLLFRISELLSCLVQAGPSLPYNSPTLRLQLTGEYVSGVAALPDKLFWDHLRHIVLSSRTLFLNSMMQMVIARDIPGAWREALASILNLEIERLISHSFLIPSEFLHLAHVDAERSTRRVVSLWGELLQSWPRMMCGAKDLAQQGVRLSRVIYP